jgi:hypothetical protein
MKVVKLAQLEQEIEARKAAIGYKGRSFILPNDGTRRTASKRALLRRLDELKGSEAQSRSHVTNRK